jgi:hypothetical protein
MVEQYLFHPDDRGTLFIWKVGNHLSGYKLPILCEVFIFAAYSEVYMTVWNAICVTYSSTGVLKCWRIFALSKSRPFPMHHTISWSHVLPGDRKQCVKFRCDERKRVVLTQHFSHKWNLCISVLNPRIIWDHAYFNRRMSNFAVERISLVFGNFRVKILARTTSSLTDVLHFLRTNSGIASQIVLRTFPSTQFLIHWPSYDSVTGDILKKRKQI